MKKHIIFIMTMIITTQVTPAQLDYLPTVHETWITGAVIGGAVVGGSAAIISYIVAPDNNRAAHAVATGAVFAIPGFIIGGIIGYTQAFETKYNALVSILNQIRSTSFLKNTQDKEALIENVNETFVTSKWPFVAAFGTVSGLLSTLRTKTDQLSQKVYNVTDRTVRATGVSLLNKAEQCASTLHGALRTLKDQPQFLEQEAVKQTEASLTLQKEANKLKEEAIQAKITAATLPKDHRHEHRIVIG